MIPIALYDDVLPGDDLGSPDMPTLTTVRRRLVARGCTVEIADVGMADQADIRLLACRAERDVTVEVLGACGGVGTRRCWAAVRVDTDQARCVWQGPERPCSSEVLAAFVADLLDGAPRRLGDRWVRLG